MAKTRMLKHDLRTSEKVASWPRDVRYFWVLLWGYVDDHGKGKDNPQLIKADCFPLDDDITADVIDSWLDLFMSDGVVARYIVADGRFLKVINWTEHQKPPHPTPDRIPGPETPGATSRALHASRMKSSGATREGFTPGLGWVESGLKGGDADAAKSTPPVDNSQRPAPHCPRHPGGTEKPCKACGDARRTYDAWTPPAITAPARPSAWRPGLCRDHLQNADTCEMCAYENRHAAEVITGRFGATA